MSQKKYHVMWEIEVSAEDVVQAARRAREMQLNDGSMADVFDVTEIVDDIAGPEGERIRVDLSALDDGAIDDWEAANEAQHSEEVASE